MPAGNLGLRPRAPCQTDPAAAHGGRCWPVLSVAGGCLGHAASSLSICRISCVRIVGFFVKFKTQDRLQACTIALFAALARVAPKLSGGKYRMFLLPRD